MPNHAALPDYRIAMEAAITRLRDLLLLERRGIAVVLVFAAVSGVAALSVPVGAQLLVSSIAFGGLIQPVIVLGTVVLMALMVAAALQALQVWTVERVLQRLMVRVTHDLAERLPRWSIGAYDRYHGPELVNRFFEVFTLQKGAATLLLEGIALMLQVVIGALLLAFYHPVLLALVTIMVMASAVVLRLWHRSGAITAIQESEQKFALTAWFEEVARNATLFRCRGGAQYALQTSDHHIRRYLGTRQQHFSVLFRQTAAFLGLQALLSASLLLAGGILVLQGKLTLGQLVAAELILAVVVAGMSKFGKYLEQYYYLVAASDKLGKLAALPLERAEGATLSDAEPLRLSLRLGVDAPWLLQLNTQSRVALLGPTAAGKSKIVETLYGLRDLPRGCVLVGDTPMPDIALAELRDRVALVRAGAVFEGSLRDNLSMRRSNVSAESLRAVLTQVGLWDSVARLPKGLDTWLTASGGVLSSGQLQCVSIARALLAQPQILLIDDCLDQLDSMAKAMILDLLLAPNAPWGVLVTTREPEVAARCRTTVTLSAPTWAGSAR